MQVYRALDQIPDLKNAVVTIGTFDGVHCGHQRVIQQLKETAAACNGETVIITFDPHPREVLSDKPDKVSMLNTLQEKIDLLQAQGIDHLVIVPFTITFSQLSAKAYIEDFLVKYFHPHIIIIGYDHRFGHNREGDINLMKQLEQQYNFIVQEIPQQIVHDISVSSTHIRHDLQAGNIALANELLGYNYFLSGIVIHGDKRGAQLGYPTANIQPSDKRKLIPSTGVYAVNVRVGKEDTVYKGMLDIGYRPTFDGKHLCIEVNIFSFDKNVYDKEITVYFKAFLREDIKFENAEALRKQMDKDKEDAMEKLS